MNNVKRFDVALLQQPGESLAATRQYEAARNARQLEHEADARFFQKTQESVIEILCNGSDNRNMETRRVSIRFTHELSLPALHLEDAAQQQSQEYVGQH